MTNPPQKDADGELDNDGWTRQQVQEFFADKYPELTELEMHILMNIHSKSSCATGIWCESELSDWVALINSHTAKVALEARDSEQNRLFSIMRALHIKHDATAIMKLRKEWDVTADAEAARKAALKQGPTNAK